MKAGTAIKLGLAVGAVLVVVYAARRASSAATSAAGAVYDAAAAAGQAVNPMNHDNVIYATANKAAGEVFTDPDGAGRNADGSFSIGAAIYDWLHPSTAQAIRDITKTPPIVPPNPYPEWDYTQGMSP